MKRLPSVWLALLVAGCGVSATRIGGTPCPGCVTDDGRCVAGTEASACGVEGERCVACPGGQACQQGECTLSLAGTGGGAGGAGGTGGGAGGTADAGLEDCSEAAKLIYVVDQDRTLSSFDPRKLGTTMGPFTSLGRLSCPAMAGAEPFSMSVDRDANAWVIYDSGELFKVNVKQQPLACAKTAFQPHLGVAKFGMGFVADAPGAQAETLFITGSDFGASLQSTKFGTLATTPPHQLTLLGTLAGAPELTGTGDGKLWAFSPNVLPPKVSRLAKGTGALEQTFEAPTLAGSPRAWAFAFWGGDFYIFLMRSTETSTQVWKMNGQTGAVSTALRDTGKVLVGAGVSTCAPVEIN